MTTLQYSDDVATVVLGNGAGIPTESEYDELRHNTTSEWMTVNGVYGMRFTAANGNSIFFPAAGQISDTTHYYAGTYGFYWHSELFCGEPMQPFNASCEQIRSKNNRVGVINYNRSTGFPVHAVHSAF